MCADMQAGKNDRDSFSRDRAYRTAIRARGGRTAHRRQQHAAPQDAKENCPAWLDAIHAPGYHIPFEGYIIHDHDAEASSQML
jgi:hypothetical protein